MDMGGAEYSSSEIALILEDIDPDRFGDVQFSEFIRWWCSDLPEQFQ